MRSSRSHPKYWTIRELPLSKIRSKDMALDGHMTVVVNVQNGGSAFLANNCAPAPNKAREEA